MNTFEKAEFIRNYLYGVDDNTYRAYHNGWVNLLNLHKGSNNLSYEFMLEVEKEINSLYDLVCSASITEKETRIPALHTKGTLHRFFNNDPVESPYPRHFLRVNDDSEEGFTDYAITHHDLKIMILDDSAEFIQNKKGNFLDYTKEAMSPA